VDLEDCENLKLELLKLCENENAEDEDDVTRLQELSQVKSANVL